MKESIYWSAMFGEIERGKSLDVAADGCGHVAGVEQHFVGHGQGQRFHVFAHAREQCRAMSQELAGQCLADIALVTFRLDRLAIAARNAWQKSSTAPQVSTSRANILTSNGFIGSAHFLGIIDLQCIMPPIPIVRVR
jgi:hypothetical protein